MDYSDSRLKEIETILKTLDAASAHLKPSKQEEAADKHFDQLITQLETKL
jgi:hypothetical protein